MQQPTRTVLGAVRLLLDCTRYRIRANRCCAYCVAHRDELYGWPFDRFNFGMACEKVKMESIIDGQMEGGVRRMYLGTNQGDYQVWFADFQGLWTRVPLLHLSDV